MNPKIKARWVKALRSGKYRQGTGKLRFEASDGVKHCCLGVLTDLYCKANKCAWEDATQRRRQENLSPHVVAWAGVPDQNPNVGHHTLAALNDGDGCPKKTFRGIATLIEKHL